MSIDRVGIVGAGVMGSEIAYAAAQAGIAVVLRDVEPELVERGIAHIREIADRRVARGRMSQEDAEALTARVSPAASDEDLAPCGLVIEAVTERIEVKLEVFRGLDEGTPPAALLASNTSGLSISELGGATSRPDRVLGLHFFNPASTMKLVEVISGERTSEGTLATGFEFVRRLGKEPVAVAECPGFLVNRVLVRALSEAYRRGGHGDVDLAAADAAVVASGPAPMGPFALGDLIGLDTLAHVQRDLEAAYGQRMEDGGALRGRVEAGSLGAKSGRGFFEGRPPEAEPDAAGDEVAERYYLGALDEAYRCLEEEIAAPGDLELAMRLGAGWSEGPLEWAAAQGAEALRARAAALQRTSGLRYRTSP